MNTVPSSSPPPIAAFNEPIREELERVEASISDHDDCYECERTGMCEFLATLHDERKGLRDRIAPPPRDEPGEEP